MMAFKVFKETIKFFKETGDSISFYRDSTTNLGEKS